METKNVESSGFNGTRFSEAERNRRRAGRQGDAGVDLGKYIIGFAFGEIYQRPQLDVRQRELVTLAALAAQGGCENQLRVHIHASLNVGLTRDEIVEAFIQCIPYLGFPKVLNAVFVAKEVFAAAE